MGQVVSGAVIASNGKLAPNFEYIAKLRQENEASLAPPGDFTSEKKVIIDLYKHSKSFNTSLPRK